MRVKTIKFLPRAVAFLDILGFKDLVRDAHVNAVALRRLSQLMCKIRSNEPLNRVLNSTVPRNLHPKSLEVSDSVILSAPLTDSHHSWYSGLAVTVMRCSQIAAILLEEGYLVSGAVNIGPAQHTQRNILGVAYQDAYEWQSKVHNPAIVLCPEAATAWQASPYRVGSSDLCLKRAAEFKDKNINGTQTLKKHETIIVNPFEPTYMNSVRSLDKRATAPKLDDAWLSARIERIEELVRGNLAQHAPGSPTQKPSAYTKWQWFDKLFREFGRPRMEEHLSLPMSLVTA